MTIKYRDKAVTQLPDSISTVQTSANFSSPSYDITQYSKYAHQLNIVSSTSLNVMVSVQESLDNVNWVTVPGSGIAFTVDGSYIWNNQTSASTYTRLIFAFTAGSALFQIYSMAKL